MENAATSTSPGLIWSPLFEELQHLTRANEIRTIICPFIQKVPLERLLSLSGNRNQLQVITCWNKNALASGASDPEIFPLLTKHAARLYIHPSIHLKLYLFGDGSSFHSSGNLTNRGMGLASSSNIEIGMKTKLAFRDWQEIAEIFKTSVPVTNLHYETARKIKATAERLPFPQVPEPEFKKSLNADFSLSALPQTPTPSLLLKSLSAAKEGMLAKQSELLSAVAHDCAHYRINSDLPPDELVTALKAAFINDPFIQSIIALIKEQNSLRFGAVTNWLQSRCSDRPVPFRKDVKTAVRVLYDWLDYFVENISWGVPGRHSMIITWKKTVD